MKHVKPSRRRLLTKNLILMLVMLVVMFVCVLSWFSFHKEVSASNMCVKLAEVADVEIAPVLDTGLPDTFRKQYTFDAISFVKDCTGDGNTFIVPSFSVTHDIRTGKEVNVNAPSVNATPYSPELEQEKAEYHYYVIEYYLRSKKDSIAVGRKSHLIAQIEKDGGSLSNTSNPPRRSSYGNFSSDAIVGAMRTAISVAPVTSVTDASAVPNPASFKRQFLWIPRPDIELETANTIGDFAIHTGLNSGDTFKHMYYTAENNNTTVTEHIVNKDQKISADSQDWETLSVSDVNQMTSNSGETSVPTLGIDKKITNFVNDVTPIEMSGENYYVYKCKTYLWIEGSDSEARRAMNSGQFHFYFEFV